MTKLNQAKEAVEKTLPKWAWKLIEILAFPFFLGLALLIFLHWMIHPMEAKAPCKKDPQLVEYCKFEGDCIQDNEGARICSSRVVLMGLRNWCDPLRIGVYDTREEALRAAHDKPCVVYERK